MSGLLLNVQCFGSTTLKSRDLDDLKLRCFCPSAEMIPAQSAVANTQRSYEINDYVCVVVIEVKKESQRLLVGMKPDLLDESIRDRVKLGLIVSQTDLPQPFRTAQEAKAKDVDYDVLLEKNVGFINPDNVKCLAESLGLSSRSSSLMETLSNGFPNRECKESLRKAQNYKWAFSHVANGIKHFKVGVLCIYCLENFLIFYYLFCLRLETISRHSNASIRL